MIYDMRTYDLNPGALQAYMDAVREVALPLREDNGIKLAGVVLYRYWEIKSRGSYLGVSRLYPFRSGAAGCPQRSPMGQ